jgi:hypothetical protein
VRIEKENPTSRFAGIEVIQQAGRRRTSTTRSTSNDRDRHRIVQLAGRTYALMDGE